MLYRDVVMDYRYGHIKGWWQQFLHSRQRNVKWVARLERSEGPMPEHIGPLLEEPK